MDINGKHLVKVAVVQAAPVLFDRGANVDKACRLIAEAAAGGAELILFPEAFIPAYPRGLSFGTVVGSRSPDGRLTWERYWANSVDVPGPVTERLGQAAREANAFVAVGVIERDSGCTGILVRPLCARNLEPTQVELDGLVDREQLLAFSGRNRTPQMQLAEKFGIERDVGIAACEQS